MAVMLDTTTYKLTTDCYYEPSLRVNECPFGDGYKQTVQDGVNPEVDQWFLSFVSLILTSAVTLEGILRNSKNGTSNVLSWTPPGGSITQYWEASKIKRVPVVGDLWKITCTLDRVNILTA